MVLSQHRTNGIKKIISTARSHLADATTYIIDYSPATARWAGFYYSTLNRRLSRDSFMVVKASPPIFITQNDRSTFNRERNITIIIFNSARTYAYMISYAASYFIYYYYYINSRGLPYRRRVVQ